MQVKKKLISLLGIIVLSLVWGCSSNVEETLEPESPATVIKGKTEFEMYEVSEMTALMELFYANNKNIKEKIERGEFELGEFPEKYFSIFSAELTDSTDRDEFLDEHSGLFLDAQKLVYNHEGNPKDNFNLMVDACIECHRVKCSGPIERISKLYIK